MLKLKWQGTRKVNESGEVPFKSVSDFTGILGHGTYHAEERLFRLHGMRRGLEPVDEETHQALLGYQAIRDEWATPSGYINESELSKYLYELGREPQRLVRHG